MYSIALLFGPMLIGAFMNALLYGVMMLQMFVYYQTYKKDATWMRLFVLYLFIAETLNTGLDIAMMYEPLILKFGTPEATTFFPLLLASDHIMTVIISTPIQVFIAWRIMSITRAKLLAIAICILALISFGGGIWLTITVVHVRRYSRKPELRWPALTWLLASAIADVVISATLAFNLPRLKAGSTGADNAMSRIVRVTVQTGIITAIFAILDVVCFLALPHTTINFIWDFALSKLYTNALISTLNARAGWGNLIGGNPARSTRVRDSSRMPQFRTLRMTHATSMDLYDQSAPTSPHSIKTVPSIDLGGISITKEVNTVHDPPTRPSSYIIAQ